MKPFPFLVAAASALAHSDDGGRVVAFVLPNDPTTHKTFLNARSTCVIDNEVFSSSLEDNACSSQMRRNDLKRLLLASADEYTHARDALDRSLRRERALRNGIQEDENESGGHVLRLLGRISTTILRWDDHQAAIRARRDRDTCMRAQLESEAFDALNLKLNELREVIVTLAERLSELNPTPVLTYGWKGYAGGNPSDDCRLGGLWKLRFAAGSDAAYSDIPMNDAEVISQDVDPVRGTLTTNVSFGEGKVKGFRVVSAGEAISDSEIALALGRVVIQRGSRFPSFFGKLVHLVQAKLLRNDMAGRNPYVELRYLDADLEIHKTGTDNWSIQTRVL